MSVIWFYVQAVLIILAAAIGLALNVTVTEFVDTVCSRHVLDLACMTPSYILELFHVRKTKFSKMSNNGKAKIFYHEIMVVWHNTVLQSGKKNGRGQVNIFWHVLRAVYCLLGPKILVTPLGCMAIPGSALSLECISIDSAFDKIILDPPCYG